MARDDRHARETRRTYRTTPAWQDLALLSLIVVVGVGVFLTWTKFR
ncbi:MULTISPECIES: hypothetical protein [unclassified Phycicoccus]|nr:MULTISPECIES: hypothetical protein [unclassified Phycicoccus]